MLFQLLYLACNEEPVVVEEKRIEGTILVTVLMVQTMMQMAGLIVMMMDVPMPQIAKKPVSLQEPSTEPSSENSSEPDNRTESRTIQRSKFRTV